jgi:lipoprotein-anchoring transpeptidase ErfK/SrfK
VLFVAATAVLVIRSRPETPHFVARPLSVLAATTTTVAPTTTTAAPAPAVRVASGPRAPVAPRAPLPPAQPALTGPFWVAASTGNSINVFRSPNGDLQEQLPPTNETGSSTVMLVKERIGEDWVEAYMPTRPNSHTGYVRAADVALSAVNTQIRVEQGYHRLTAWAGDQMIGQEPVAIGKPGTPTPNGIFYLAMLFRTPNPRGAYGPYVFGLSAHSNVFERFGGGDGMVGLHGTNEPGSVGRSASHGCLRLSNAAIARLVQLLPIGTPIVITP